jgi:alpha-galactosidase
MAAASASATVATTPEELAQKDEWVRQNLLAEQGGVPFSFTYGGKASAALLPGWERKAAKNKLDDARTEHALTWTDAKTGLEVRCRGVEYSDYPVVEWTVFFKNTGKADSPILDDIQGLDASFRREGKEGFVLRTIRGDDYSAASYQPIVVPLGDGAQQRFASAGGRPTDRGFPYFNLEWDGRGAIAVLGWPGQWAAKFECDKQRRLRIVGGQELTRLKLLPGEEVRAPLALLMFWKGGDAVRAQNLWRRFYMAHVLPRPNGKPPAPLAQIQVCSALAAGNDKALFDLTKAYLGLGVKVDLCWLDAGWYPCGGNWPATGTWEIDAKRYPRGFKPFTDSIHAQGMRFILWFEPERVGDGNSWLAKQHPDWLLGGKLLDLGNSKALAWAIEHFDAMIKAQGVDIYRQDFNMEPLEFWRRNDAPDRQGITENLHVQGYLAYWDALLKRNPGLLIDSCASGGRRNDLETVRRSVPLLRSDYQAPSNPNVVESNQSQTHGLSSWLPYYGTGSYSNEKYWARSFYMAGFGFGADADGARAYAECRKIAPLMLGDYHPLTPHAGGTDLAAWIAWQFDRPEQGDGVVQAFRRPQAKEGELRFKLRGLDPAAAYELTDFDKAGTTRSTGRELMESGLAVKLDPRQSAIVTYRKTTGGQ